MPLTFFAHQAPMLPVARRLHGRLDPLAIVIGTMAPDIAYAVDGVGGRHIRAHELPALVWFCVPVTLAICWLVVRLIAPVIPDHLPRATVFALPDYRGLAAHRFRLVPSIAGAFLGAVSHAFLDEFTHSFGWAARTWAWYRRPLTDARWLDKVWAPFEVAQFTGHLLFSAWCIWLLARYGRQRWFAAAAARVPAYPTSPRSFLVLWGTTVAVSAAGLLFVLTHRRDEATDIVRFVGAVFVGMSAGAAMLRSARSGRTTVASGRSDGAGVT